MTLDQYLDQNTSPESALLQALQRETHLKVLQANMLSGSVQGRLLAMIAKVTNAQQILEIGTYTGYSMLCLAESLGENGQLHTIEVNLEREQIIRKYINLAGLEAKITLHLGQATAIIPILPHNFDLVFIDADKLGYPQYYELALTHTRQGASILIDNVLWKGKVLDLDNNQDKKTKALHAFNQYVQEDMRTENVLLPLRDGVMWVRKK